MSLAVVMREQTVAQRSAPPSDPANRWFLRPSVNGPDRALNGVGVEFKAAIIQEAAEEMPAA